MCNRYPHLKNLFFDEYISLTLKYQVYDNLNYSSEYTQSRDSSSLHHISIFLVILGDMTNLWSREGALQAPIRL